MLVSTMWAAWYRYVQEWRFQDDGTIVPRMGFAATQNCCTCIDHTHHAYWRLDLDVVNTTNTVIEVNGNQEELLSIETMQERKPGRKWRIEHASGKAYEVVPGQNDGTFKAMEDGLLGAGDLWFLLRENSEYDDHYSLPTWPPLVATFAASAFRLNSFANDGAPIKERDVVVWYGAHFLHVQEKPGDKPVDHWVGPTLKPIGF